jgi:uncharacterized protein YfaS (alpha-2-macroglobulin family)
MIPIPIFRLFKIFGIIFLASLVLSCKMKRKVIHINPAFSKYIEAFTSGVISKKNAIRLQLSSDINTVHTLYEELDENLFSFSPKIAGKAYWIDNRTIEFKPDKELNSDEFYEVSFHLNKIASVPDAFKTFTFNIQTPKPTFQITQNGLYATGKETMMLKGMVTTADVEESKSIESLLSASLNSKELEIKWQHNESGKIHDFIIENIKRKTQEEILDIQVNGNAIHANKKELLNISIPAIHDFKVLNINAVQGKEKYISIQFSDAIAINQQLDGLIAVSNQEHLSYSINSNEVKVFSSDNLVGTFSVNINPGIQNLYGDKIGHPYSGNIVFDKNFPIVKIHGRGIILPNSGGKVVLPFDAINLKAVDVSIIKVYENNIPQFLQYNSLDGDEQLRRVAKPIVQTTVRLDEDPNLDLHKQNRFALDLDKYIKTEPGAIYRVNIGFRPEYSLSICRGGISGTKTEDDGEDYDYDRGNESDEDNDFWKRYNNYYEYGYNWEQRDNPCSNSYYNKDKYAFRNILSTNIGLTAKIGNENKVLVFANNLINTESLSDVDLQVLDYQLQIIGTGKSNTDGYALIENKRKPFLLVAKKGNEKSYLKLDDGNSLPLSRFDVNGVEVKNGIKGFVFGERGVWRPGDSLFLGCIIEDKDKKLPADHPIEMDLYSPKGQLYKKILAKNSSDGFNIFRTATDASAPTGNWICRVKLGGAVFEKQIIIETVMPNRLKIDLNFGSQLALGKNNTTNGILTAKWLFGAVAQNLKARVDVQLYKRNTAFEGLKDYAFDDPTAEFNTISKTIFDGSLSTNGTAPVNSIIDSVTDAPGVLLANMTVKVFEPGGNFSIDNITMPFHAYASYAGVKVPEGDKKWGYIANNKVQSFNLANVSTNGEVLKGNTDVEVEIYKIRWRWWWDNTNSISNFSESEYNKLLKKESIRLFNGKGLFNYSFKENEYGRYLIMVKDIRSGHKTGKIFYVDDDSWQRRSDNFDAGAAAMLAVSADKTKYNVGEEVRLNIPSSKNGRALVSIENGSRVLKTFWIKTQQGETKFSFKAEKEMTPNIYVNISLLQPHAQTLNDLPIRMYGVIPITIESKDNILKPTIRIADVIKPEQNTSITVGEENGKAFSYIVAIVDEGLLDLTRFKTPNPYDAFYAKEGLGIKSWDLYDYVIGAWGGELERILTIGGDAENLKSAKNRKANRFKPVVKFLGPFKSNGGNQTHNFVLPSYMGSVRAMVIAANNGAYGVAEKAVIVKKPVILYTTLPRVLAPGEEFRLPVTVIATDNTIKSVKISAQVNALVEISTTPELTFTVPGEQTVFLTGKVKAGTGLAKINVTATAGKEQTASEVEIDVRNPNPPITQVTEFTLKPGESYNGNLLAIGDGGNNKATIELSSIPALNLEKRLNYLIRYPYGCIEQTVSAVFPQLVLNDLLDLNGEEQVEVQKNIRYAIGKLQNFQLEDGGFSYWPEGEKSDDWGSNYAGNFLLEAAARGYAVPSSLMQQWRIYAKAKAIAWIAPNVPWYGADLIQAYRLYLLALANAPEIGAMNRLKEFKFLSQEAKWRLAAAYALVGQTQIALQLVSGLSTNFPIRNNWGLSYGSELRDQAMALETLTILKRLPEAEVVVRDIAGKLSLDTWYSTQTTAYSLIAIAKFSGFNANNKKIDITGKTNNQGINVNTSNSLFQQKVTFQNGKATVQLKNNGSNVIYGRLINEGKPLSTQTVSYTNNPAQLQVSLAYTNTKGEPIDISKLKQGTDFIAKVSIKNTGNRGAYNQMALTQIFPSGWEILNTRLYNNEGVFKSSRSDYMDIKDDRVYHFFNIKQGEAVTYFVQLNAAYAGKYYWPGVYCEAMYNSSISGGINGKWVEIIE